MRQKTINNNLIMLTASEGCVLRRKGGDPHSEIRNATVTIADLDNWEDVPVADIPPYTKAEYDAKVAELVRSRYSESEEFALQRKMLNAMLPQPATLSDDSDTEPFNAEKAMAEYTEYNTYVEQCKLSAPAAIAEDKLLNELPQHPLDPPQAPQNGAV